MHTPILVAYFSCTGTTRAVAQMLTDILGADLYEIKPQVPYTTADLDWRNRQSRSTVEMEDPTSRPAIAGHLPSLERYQTVFLGFPIWWYRAPTIINTFLEKVDVSGKSILLFATSGGSGFGKTVAGLRESVTPSTRILEGSVFRGQPSKKELYRDIDRWLHQAGISPKR